MLWECLPETASQTIKSDGRICVLPVWLILIANVSLKGISEKGFKRISSNAALMLSVIWSDEYCKRTPQTRIFYCSNSHAQPSVDLLWSYDFSLSSPLVHPKQWNHTICFQGSVLTTDKHSSDCGGNWFFLKLLCVPLSARSPWLRPRRNACKAEAALKGPLF